MPIYEFRCKKCESSFEEFVHSYEGNDEFICPNCGSKDVDKLFSPFSSGSSNASSSSSCSSSRGFT